MMLISDKKNFNVVYRLASQHYCSHRMLYGVGCHFILGVCGGKVKSSDVSRF